MTQGFLVQQWRVGEFQNFNYGIIDQETLECWIVDPHKGILSELSQELSGLKIAGVLLTHTHWDHTNGVEEILAQLPEIKVYVHEADQFRLKESGWRDQVHRIVDQECLELTPRLRVKVHHTPGHSAGGVCFEVNREYLITGDTLFINDCGRTDLETGDPRQMWESMKKLRVMDPGLIVLPGHQYHRLASDTLGGQCLTNAALRAVTLEEFMALP